MTSYDDGGLPKRPGPWTGMDPGEVGIPVDLCETCRPVAERERRLMRAQQDQLLSAERSVVEREAEALALKRALAQIRALCDAKDAYAALWPFAEDVADIIDDLWAIDGVPS